MTRRILWTAAVCVFALFGCSQAEPKLDVDNSNSGGRAAGGLVPAEVRFESATIRPIDETELDIRWTESAPDEVVIATPGSIRRIHDTGIDSLPLDSRIDSMALLDGELFGCSVGESPALVPLEPPGQPEQIEGTGGNCERLGIECIFENTETCRLGGSAENPVAALHGFYNTGQREGGVTFLGYRYADGELERYDSLVEPSIVGVLPGGESVFAANTDTNLGRMFHKDGAAWIDAPENGALYVMKNHELTAVGWVDGDAVSAGVLSDTGLEPFATFSGPTGFRPNGPFHIATLGLHAVAAVDDGDVARFSLGSQVYEYPLESEDGFATLLGVGLTDSSVFLFLTKPVDGTFAVVFHLVTP